MNKYMELYSQDARNGISEISLSGKRQFLKYPLKKIVPDVVNKLNLKPTDKLLDIGCNCGEITIPISFFCDRVLGIDGDGVIERLRERSVGIHNIDTLIGDFLETEISEQFDCILIYSVLVYIDSYEDKVRFIKKAASLLKHGGRMLVGDIINSSVVNRYKNSEYGKALSVEYEKLSQADAESDDNTRLQSHGPELVNVLNDETLMKLLLEIRSWGGYESFLLPQDHDLAFGCTRQDILIKAW